MSTTSMARHRGISLIELVIFIAVVGVAVAGVLVAMNTASRGSADPMLQKQALAIAEALLEEVQLQPFTFCDPDDANAATATEATTNAAGCAATVEAMGPDGGETRTGDPPFDNVNDYFQAGGLALAAITDVSGTAIPALAGFSATINVATQALGGIGGTDTNGRPQSLLITVRVTGPGGTDVGLQGYRVRYAPNALP